MTTKTKMQIEVRELEIVLTRSFDAPRELVWQVITSPEHVANWWGPRHMTTKVLKMDMRPGGEWRFENISPDGRRIIFKGEYLEIQAPERVVQTFGMEGMFEDKRIVETATLTEVDGKTIFQNVSRFESNADRDGMLATGMAKGAGESYDQLEELLVQLLARLRKS